ncbi:MAG: DNA polymerase IV [Ilumatobacteraceae bacterium]
MSESGQQRVILHVDMDAFYVSVELLRRPELVGLPVVVGGDGSRGVVAAASYEARRHGVHSAMASVTARRRCPSAVFLPADHQRYAEVSAEVREVFDSVTPLVEPLALDEAFLDVTGVRSLLGEPSEIAETVRRRVADRVGLSCSVGVASNKFVAKLASVEAKPIADRDGVRAGPGVVVVEPGMEAAFVATLPVERLWGVGPKTLARLHDIGIRRVPDIVAAPEGLLEGRLGASAATHLRRLALGIDDRPVETDRGAKSIGQEETFGSDISDLDVARAEMIRLADSVASRLRGSTVAARTVTLKAKFADFDTVTRSVTAGEPLDTAGEIIERLEPALRELIARGPVRLLGVSASNLVEPARQLDLWSQATTGDGLGSEAHDGADRALDEIRARFGRSSIGRASGLRPRTR